MRVFVSAQEVPTPESTPPPRIYPVALPNYDEETATRLQIFLDNSDFAPGKIDGRMGEFFRKALISYKHAQAMPKTGAVDQWMLDQVPVTYTTYTISSSACSQSRPDRKRCRRRLAHGKFWVRLSGPGSGTTKAC